MRRYSSTDQPEPVNEKELDVPTYWIRPPQILSAEAGIASLRLGPALPAAGGRRGTYPISAIYRDTPSHAARAGGASRDSTRCG